MDIQQLSISERVLLAQQLWDSVVVDQGVVEVSDEQKAELDRRLANYQLVESNMLSPWSEVKKRVVKD